MKQKLIEVYSGWIERELGDIIVRTDHFKNMGDYGELDWPLSTTMVYKEDAENIASGLGRQFSGETKCALAAIDAKLEMTTAILDKFFLSLHCIGHVICSGVSATDMEDNNDIALVETSCLLFAAVACHHYFNLDHLTPFMATEIAWALYDRAEIELKDGKKYTSDQYVDLCGDILESLKFKEINLH